MKQTLLRCLLQIKKLTPTQQMLISLVLFYGGILLWHHQLPYLGVAASFAGYLILVSFLKNCIDE